MNTHESDCILFTREQLIFRSDSSLTVRLDFWALRMILLTVEVIIPPGDVVQLDPIQSLKEYVAKTASVCASYNPVFIALKQPYVPLATATVGKIMKEAI